MQIRRVSKMKGYIIDLIEEHELFKVILKKE